MMVVLCRTPGDGQRLCQVIDAIGQSRITSYQTKLQAAAEKSKLQHAAAMVYIKTKEGSGFPNMTWVPGSLEEHRILPESLGTFGSPWLCAGGQGSFRYGPEDIPFSGFGHFLHGVSGTVLVMAWPVSFLVGLAVDTEDGMKPFSGMKKDIFDQTVQTQVFHTLLRKGQSVWIPGGYCDCHVSLQDTLVSHTLLVPYMNTTLVSAINTNAREAVVGAFQRFLRAIDTKVNKPWGQIGPAFILWLRGTFGDVAALSEVLGDESDDDHGNGNDAADDSATIDPNIGS